MVQYFLRCSPSKALDTGALAFEPLRYGLLRHQLGEHHQFSLRCAAVNLLHQIQAVGFPIKVTRKGALADCVVQYRIRLLRIPLHIRSQLQRVVAADSPDEIADPAFQLHLMRF